jgi:apolipoprotein N-acyltransferase
MRVKDYILAASSGLILVLAFPKLNFEPLAFCAFVPLLFALEGKGLAQTFFLSLLAGVVFNLMLLNWVVVVMRNYGSIPFPLSLLILLLFAGYLGVYVGLSFTVARFIEEKNGPRMALTLPCIWVLFEYAKSHLLTGFPWENLGYSQFLSLPLVQVADVTGVYGISFLIVLFNTFLFSLLTSWRARKAIPWFETFLILSLFSMTIFYGYKRMASIQDKVQEGYGVNVKLIQPNIEQAVKWDPAYQEETLKILGSLSLASSSDTPDLLIWPEAAVPFYFQLKSDYTRWIVKIIRQINSYLLLGSPAFTVEGSQIKYHNSAFLFSPGGEVLGRYDKIHLVPFGEYVPLKRLLFFVNKMVADIGDFSPGEQIQVLSFQEKSLGVLICYEIIFPELARECIQKGATFLVTITNDAWFGKTSAPYQHNSMAAFRAIENRVFVARAANTGITSIIDPTGRIVSATELFTPDVVTGKIKIIRIPTLYNRYGDIFVLICTIFSAMFLVGCLIKSEK